MRRKKTQKRKIRKVFCFIVEGCTEENSIKCLKQIFRTSGAIYNCKGGPERNIL